MKQEIEEIDSNLHKKIVTICEQCSGQKIGYLEATDLLLQLFKRRVEELKKEFVSEWRGEPVLYHGNEVNAKIDQLLKEVEEK